jgi:hypothetical protein
MKKIQNARSINGYIDLGTFENFKYSRGVSEFTQTFVVVLMVISVTYHCILGGLYYIRRNQQPLKSRKITLILMILVFNSLFTSILCLKFAIEKYFNCVAYNILSLGMIIKIN